MEAAKNMRLVNAQELYRQVKNKWTSIYPAYFDKTKSISQGRRLPKSLCIDQPTLQQLVRALNTLFVRSIVEGDKSYPKDWMVRGRIKVEIKNAEGKPIHSHIANKQQLLKQIGNTLTILRKK